MAAAFYKSDRITPPQLFMLLVATAGLLFSLAGCSSTLGDSPELSPDKFAAASPRREWQPPSAVVREENPAQDSMVATAPQSLGSQQPYDLAGLIDVALRNSPRTRRSWEAARSAAASYGAARSPYYPQAAVESDSGYARVPFELPGTFGVVRQWQSDSEVALTYTLLDFGRRASASELARERLIAANFLSNRTIQDVVFGVEQTFYAFDAVDAAVAAAKQNLELARADFDSVKQRVDLGLATRPELLLAQERLAQSRFDLANAEQLLRDAQANLAVALGIAADVTFKVESLDNETVPKSLSQDVETLIAQARRLRPDLAARKAQVRASDAAVKQAQAQWYPTVDASGIYGENLWNYTFVTPRTVQVSTPQYSAMLTIKWDLFTGFRRLNDVRKAEADRETARADLKILEIDAVAEVWRAYFEFQSSLSKYEYALSLMASSEESYSANSESYRQGLSTIVELLTAQRDLASARYTLIQSKSELLTAYAAVAYAIGRVDLPSK
jgi:outer membrane protein